MEGTPEGSGKPNERKKLRSEIEEEERQERLKKLRLDDKRSNNSGRNDWKNNKDKKEGTLKGSSRFLGESEGCFS
jgi:hypothetical protein